MPIAHNWVANQKRHSCTFPNRLGGKKMVNSPHFMASGIPNLLSAMQMMTRSPAISSVQIRVCEVVNFLVLGLMLKDKIFSSPLPRGYASAPPCLPTSSSSQTGLTLAR